MIRFLVISIISMSVFLGLYYLVLQREKMYRFNRFYLIGSLVFSLVLPFISIPLYVEAGAAPPVAYLNLQTVAAAIPIQPTPIAAPATKSINYWPYVLWGVYGTVTLLFIIRFVLNIAKFLRVKKENTNLPYKGATLVLLEEATPPHTFFGSIFVSRTDYANRHAEPGLFIHELAHVNQCHTLDILFVEALKTLMWFNPALYLYKRAIQLNHEFLADEKTISQFNNIPAYQQMLLDRSVPYSNHLLASSINFPVTKKRFLMMTKTTTKGRALFLKVAILPVLVALVYALSTKTIARERAFNKPDAQQTLTDSTEYRKKRDAYYSGVKVVIDDQANNVYINKPFEELTEKEKSRYYFLVPQGKEMTFIPETEYAKLQDKKGYSVAIDNLPVDNAYLLKHNSAEFVYYSAITRAKSSLTKERPQIFEYYLYTLPYYNKYLKIQEPTHYPDSIFTVSITKEYKNNKVVAASKPMKLYSVKASKNYNDKDVINYTDVDRMPQYAGGMVQLNNLIASGFKAPKTANPDITTYYLNVIIEPDGQLSYARVFNAEDEATTEEMIRILKTTQDWKPGTLKGKAVRTSYTFKVTLN